MYIEEEYGRAGNIPTPDAESWVSNVELQMMMPSIRKIMARENKNLSSYKKMLLRHKEEVAELSEDESENDYEEPDETEEQKAEPILAKYVRRHP